MVHESSQAGVLWTPDSVRIEVSHMSRFMSLVNTQHGLDLTSYEDLHGWSVKNCGTFWSDCWDYVQLLGEKGVETIRGESSMTDAQFYPGGVVNFAENCLRLRDDAPAVAFGLENRPTTLMSRHELYKRVSRLSRWLRDGGVVKGDRVCAVVSNTPDSVVCALATLAVGAIWSSVSPDFGVEGVVERFAQITPKVFFHSDTYYNKNRLYDVSLKMVEIEKILRAQEPGLMSVCISDDDWLDALIPDSATPTEFARTNFNDPAFIMFSSGTTGKPKCIVHRHGVILQLMKEHQLHCDINPNDKVFYYTTTTWMMWNWLVGALASNACIMLYEGNPFYPDSNVLFQFASKASFFGVSAKFIDSLRNDPHFVSPGFESINTIASTGSPLVPESFDFIYSKIKSDVMVASICGGTDILSCFILGCPIKPVKRGYAQCRGLGMDVQVWDESPDGRPAPGGTKGELVCCTPFPSQPIGFWGDDANKTKYKEAYFNTWPNVWKHGDFCSIDVDGHVFVYGRSDATLKPGGVRIGTAEIYRAVETLSFVKESVCCGIELKPGDESVALFVVLTDPKSTLSDDMRNEIKAAVLKSATRHHVPRVIECVSDIPRTRSGKVVELAVKQILRGDEIKNMNALANPEALEQFRKWTTAVQH
jgi:acetoacetyl-CoA synthetase